MCLVFLPLRFLSIPNDIWNSHVTDASAFFHSLKAFAHDSSIIVGVTVQIWQNWESASIKHNRENEMTLWWAAKSITACCPSVKLCCQSSETESHIVDFFPDNAVFVENETVCFYNLLLKGSTQEHDLAFTLTWIHLEINTKPIDKEKSLKCVFFDLGLS